ncbi:MAG: outer membrane lipoprotein carrier protein LolA [Phycisphaerales bacterium]
MRRLVGFSVGVLALGVSAARVSGETPRDGGELLQRVEAAHAGVRTLAAEVAYDRRFLLQGDRHVRLGTFYYRASSAEESRAFAVLFERLWVGERVSDDPEGWIFDSEWLVEEHPREKRFIRRRMGLAGADPLAPSQSPIPLPVGLKAGEVLAQFTSEVREAEDGVEDADRASLPFLGETVQLVLTPRESAGRKPQFREVRLWFDRETYLPRMARTVERSGDESWVVLINLEPNAPGAIPENVFSTEPPEPGSGWDVQTEEGGSAQ